MLELALRRFSQKNSFTLLENGGTITVHAGETIVRLGKYFEVITPSTKIVMSPNAKAWADDRSLNVAWKDKKVRVFRSRDGKVRVVVWSA